ncbi:ModD protein [Pseudothauera rhizosphaerae]|uniref:Putative pyrophosphorylase ModD n=1 Tax=Pseudothauera rhizosphaerae TaxID=2565932 RepID=A0A4V3W9X0_9RHOO|nr:ModD protein [Pseudothauera rhizosphaerae]THF56895.1 ModD protein [Pseudothauera rhizosphaerae]
MNDCALSDEALTRLLADDVPAGDLTTETLGIAAAPARTEFRARGAMCACGLEEARRLFELAGATRCLAFAGSGSQVAEGALLLSAEGPAGALHRAWKTAQNLVEWMSGVATAAAAIVDAARPLAVACTRKNVPGTKALSIKAVRAGGAIVHRLGLSETLLVFAEHRLFLDLQPGAVVRRLRALQPEKRAVVEVGDVDEALAWAAAGAEILQLEKFPPPAVAALRERLRAAGFTPLLVATGGVNALNAAAYAVAGADMIATSAPYNAPPADVAVRFERLGNGARHV